MQLDKLIFWKLDGTPDVFTETRDGWEWLVVHSGGATHWAGFYQVVGFERKVGYLAASAFGTLYTTGGGLGMRVGIDPTGGNDPRAVSVIWGPWEGPDNSWDGKNPKVLDCTLTKFAPTVRATVFLESRCRWRVTSNTARWHSPTLVFDYAEPDPPVPPKPPDPDVPPQIVTLKEAMRLAGQLLEQAAVLMTSVEAVLELFDVEPHIEV